MKGVSRELLGKIKVRLDDMAFSWTGEVYDTASGPVIAGFTFSMLQKQQRGIAFQCSFAGQHYDETAQGTAFNLR